MGSWFSNIQIKCADARDSLSAEHIVQMFAQKHNLEKADKEVADMELAVFRPQNSSWMTVVSDLIDGDAEILLALAKEISRELKTEVLAISCFDSDYLFLNLLDVQNGVDAWASCGSFPGGKAPRRSNFAAWKASIGDMESFRTAMRSKYTFAEECLYAVEPLLGLPVAQSMRGEPDSAEAVHVYFKYSQKEERVCPPAFGCRIREIFYRVGENPNVVSFQNQGGASRGVAVCFTGPCIHDRQAEVTSVCLQLHDHRGEWVFVPVNLQMIEFSDGIQRLYGECRDVRIPPAVSEKLPLKKKMDLEFQRSISIRFSVTDKGRAGNADNRLGDLHVVAIPLQNFSGQCGLVLKQEEVSG